MTDSEPVLKRAHVRWKWVALALVGMGLFAGFVGLGVWQLQRLAWKQDLIDRVGQRLTAPASDLPTPEEWPELQAQDFEYRHVRVQGNWLHRHTVLTQATTVLGQGFWVITPLQQVDGSAVLVNRGFIPAQQRNQWLHAPSAPADSGKLVVIQGLMRQTEPKGGFLRRNDPQNQKWYSRDVAAIAAAQQLPLTAPFFVDVGLPDVTLHAYAESQPASIGPWPREGLTIVRFSNSHKVYALTWFALAIMVVGAGVLVTRYERRLRSAHHNSGHGHPQ